MLLRAAAWPRWGVAAASRALDAEAPSPGVPNQVPPSSLTLVLPALNEATAIASVLADVPAGLLADRGYVTEILVVDNGSTDATAAIARDWGARVVVEPRRGYGHALRTGFAHAGGDLIATADADWTYPLGVLPEAIRQLTTQSLDFLHMDRLTGLDPRRMPRSHRLGNVLFTRLARRLYGWPFVDSQSGMWLFRRAIWPQLQVRATGMAFSQEIKLRSFLAGYRCGELPITYRARVGQVKLDPWRDGPANLAHLLSLRYRLPRR
jgi:hypothetical protein